MVWFGWLYRDDILGLYKGKVGFTVKGYYPNTGESNGKSHGT